MNQSGRMDKVRYALGQLRWAYSDLSAAALAEVEEWEASRQDADLVHETATIRAATLQAAHAANMKAAEAEADRLKAALEAIVQELSEEHVSLTVVLRIAHAALAPADRNTT